MTKLRLNDFKGPPKSFGDYLCLADAADVIGSQLIPKWRKSDLAKLADSHNHSLSWERAKATHEWLIALLVGGMVGAFGQNHEGSYFVIERERLSAPFFNINIPRSEYLWTPEDWDVIFVSKSDLADRLKVLRPSKPRETVQYDWREISCLAWRLALDDVTLRKPSRLIAAVRLQYSLKTDKDPDEKDLRNLVNDVIGHLGDRVLSREASDALTPRAVPRDAG